MIMKMFTLNTTSIQSIEDKFSDDIKTILDVGYIENVPKMCGLEVYVV